MHYSYLVFYIFIFVAATVSFEQSTYNVNEDDKVAILVLLVSNPVSKRLNIRLLATDGSATGKHRLNLM